MKTRCSCLLFRHRGFFGLRTCRKVKLDLPFTVQDEARAERFAGLRTEAGKHFGRTSIFDQLARDLRRDRAARDSLPDHVAAAGLLAALPARAAVNRSEEHTSELQSQSNLVCRLLLEKKKQHE